MAGVNAEDSCSYFPESTCLSGDGYCVGGLCARRLFNSLPDELRTFDRDEMKLSSGYVDGDPTSFRDFGHRISNGIEPSGSDS
jgi:hypothetical protein